jgi:hypothetical protein
VGRQLVREYRQRITAAPAQVFPLLCPVREGDWAASGHHPAGIDQRWDVDDFNTDLAWWEASMNHYLATGRQLLPA